MFREMLSLLERGCDGQHSLWKRILTDRLDTSVPALCLRIDVERELCAAQTYSGSSHVKTYA